MSTPKRLRPNGDQGVDEMNVDAMPKEYNVLPDSEFRSICDTLSTAAKEAQAILEKAFRDVAPRLVQCSKTQKDRIKELFRKHPFISAEYIDRLVLFGAGKMPEYLAMSIEAKISADTWAYDLSEETKEDLSNPKFSVQVAIENEDVDVEARKLSPEQWKQVLGNGRTLSGQEQRERAKRDDTPFLTTAYKDKQYRIVVCAPRNKVVLPKGVLSAKEYDALYDVLKRFEEAKKSK